MKQSHQALMDAQQQTSVGCLRNILKRVDEKVIDLGPKARMAAEVDKTTALSQKFLKDGEICY